MMAGGMNPVPIIMMIITTPFTPIMFRMSEEEDTGRDSMGSNGKSTAAGENGSNAVAEDSAAKNAVEKNAAVGDTEDLDN